MDHRRPTIRDVARAAGVGVGTVSRVLAGGAGVGRATAARVRTAVERLGYEPSPVARALSRRRTQTIDVLVPPLTDYAFAEVLRGVETVLAETDYSLVIRTVERESDRERVFRQCCAAGRTDGALIISLVPTAELASRLSRAGFPVVLVDTEYDGLSSVGVDHADGAALAVRHCIALGHRRIALIDYHGDPFTPAVPTARQRGYRAAMAEAGLPVAAASERLTTYSPEAGAAALDQLLAAPEPPTAIVAGSDLHAVGALDAAGRRGLRVPDDLSIVGYGDIRLAQYLGLTTVSVPMRALGRRAVELLFASLGEPGRAPETIRLAAGLVVRETCGPPPDAA